MPSYTAAGLVLRRINLGETDKILTLYTREHGKLSAVAKGARRAGSRLSGATELFTYSRNLLARATYLCELLDRLTLERDATMSEELCDLTLSALYLLKRAQDYPDGVVHAYELRLLAALGYAPVLDRCVRCGAP